MKSFVEYIDEYMCENMLLDIDNEIFCEALQEPHLIEIAKWLRNFGTKSKSSWRNKSFSSIFGQFNIAWDKVTSEDFKTYEAGDKEGIQSAIAVHKQGDKFQHNLVLFLNDKDKIYAMLTCYGIKLLNTDNYTKRHPRKQVTDNDGYVWDKVDYDSWEDVATEPDDNFRKLLQKDTREMCNEHKFMVLNLNEKKFQIHDIKRDRYERKQDVLSPDMYYNIAAQNRARYKKIIAKNKAEKLAKNDKISKEVNEIVTKVLELTQKVMQGGAKYADLDYKMQCLLETCYGKRIYTGDTRYGKSGYQGSDGLLALFAQYVKTNMSAAGDTSYSTGDASKYIAPVRKKIDQINTQIQEIESKL